MELAAFGLVVLLNGSMAAVLFVRGRRNPVVVLRPGHRMRYPRLLAVQYLLTALGFAALAVGGSVSDNNALSPYARCRLCLSSVGGGHIPAQAQGHRFAG